MTSAALSQQSLIAAVFEASNAAVDRLTHLLPGLDRDRLRKVRRASGDSQRDFAKVLHATQEAVSAWEAGRNYPRDVVAIAQRIERAYGVSAGWVLGITENPRPGGPDGGDMAPPPGLEPGTLWLPSIRGATTAFPLDKPVHIAA